MSEGAGIRQISTFMEAIWGILQSDATRCKKPFGESLVSIWYHKEKDLVPKEVEGEFSHLRVLLPL